MAADEQNGRASADALRAFARSVAESLPAVVDLLVAGRAPRLHREVLALLERPLIAHVLARTAGNQLRAAHLLGLNRNTLRKRCRELGLASPRAPRRAAMR